MTETMNHDIIVEPYHPGTDLDTELAVLGYASIAGWPDQRPITDSLLRSRLRPIGHARPTVLATHRDPAGRLTGAAALRWSGYPGTPGRLWGPLVPPVHHRRGLGRALLAALSEHLNASPDMILTAEIPGRRAAAAAFFLAAGWKPARGSALFKHHLHLPSPATPPAGVRVRCPAPNADLAAALAALAEAADPGSPAAGDTFARWSADERFSTDGLALADDGGRLIGAALAYPLAHRSPNEPAEVLLADLIMDPESDDPLLQTALITTVLNTAAANVGATVARAVTSDQELADQLTRMRFDRVDDLHYLRYVRTAIHKSETPR